ncbi:[NiFe] hydrogenase nickel incorporation protein HypA [Thioalkalivibrio nitratireducens DSM 14787]|uniref:Hydrogenase maturation factor HypA n=1 Tax=Thioalkalivibrio nitratireducens (strain DSM 14787 / UNIQEM 213 / ALEN2) TaxID=1255043 RepID=L0DXD6_THIND|nr:hydrogenase maturation nickel metallochaperone HypA [Thioalkalivibrio nitratireducens]AGA33708.1 [NiFe] hydrogenase nickel incorporation protein HypA [Thioalkalivibrio nitratireducens DSM 14787]
MHEMSLAEGILQIIEDQAAQRGFHRVRRVRLEVGELSGVELDALRFGFDAVMADSIASGAVLEIVEVPGEGWCLDCNTTVAIGALFDACPLCGSYRVRASGGMDMRVLDLEVETVADCTEAAEGHAR